MERLHQLRRHDWDCPHLRTFATQYNDHGPSYLAMRLWPDDSRDILMGLYPGQTRDAVAMHERDQWTPQQRTDLLGECYDAHVATPLLHAVGSGIAFRPRLPDPNTAATRIAQIMAREHPNRTTQATMEHLLKHFQLATAGCTYQCPTCGHKGYIMPPHFAGKATFRCDRSQCNTPIDTTLAWNVQEGSLFFMICTLLTCEKRSDTSWMPRQ